MCGEKDFRMRYLCIVLGSPPHVRGKGKMEGEQNHQDRITPACAGKSSSALVTFDLGRDHPRMCGEKTKKIP